MGCPSFAWYTPASFYRSQWSTPANPGRNYDPPFPERSYKRIGTYDTKGGKPFSDRLDDSTAQSLYNVGLVRADSYMETLYLHNELGNQLLTLLNAK